MDRDKLILIQVVLGVLTIISIIILISQKNNMTVVVVCIIFSLIFGVAAKVVGHYIAAIDLKNFGDRITQ